MLEFRLLGRLEATADGVTLALGSGKQRALLAFLLLRRNRAVSREALIDALWGDAPPATAAHALDVYVSRLRKAFPTRGLLETRQGAFVLKVADEAVDVGRFEQRLADARAATEATRRLAALEEALALWRGQALADVLTEPFARAESERLEEERLAAAEERFEALLAPGRHDEAVSALQSFTITHPLRERPRGQLMLALYRAGRQSEALAVYRDTHAMLHDELGLEPGPELRELEAAILRQDETLAAPARPPPIRVRARVSGRLAVLVVCAVVAVAGGVTAAVLVIGGRGSRLSRIDFNGIGLIDARSGRILREVVPSWSTDQLVADGDVVWAVGEGEGTVSRIAPNVVQPIPVGSSANGIAVSGGSVWVADGLDGTVSRIDRRASRVVQRIAVGHQPRAVAVGAGSVWVANAGDRTISRIDAKSGKRVATIASGADGQALAVGLGAVWAVDQSTDTVVKVDPAVERVAKTIPVGAGADAIAVAFGSIWVANGLSGTVSRIDVRGGVSATVDVGGDPIGLAAAAKRLWIADGSNRRIDAIDPASDRIVRKVPIGSRPVAITGAGSALWVSVEAPPEAHRGGTLRVTLPPGGFLGAPLDPALAFSPAGWSILTMTGDGLVTFLRSGGSEGAQIVPDLATSIPIPRDGGTSYTFQLRRGIHYSNGASVSPADFRFALERVFRLHSPGADFYGGIVGAAACARRPRRCDLSRGILVDPGSSTVTFRLARPDPEFLDKLALPFADAVPAATTPADKAVAHLPGTGPYRFAQATPHKRAVLVRNPHFREWSHAAQPLGFPDRIEFAAPQPLAHAARAIERGKADAMSVFGSPARRLAELETQYASQLHVHPYAEVHYVFLNTRLAPFDDIRVRRALNYALDRTRIVRLHGGRQVAQPTCQLLPPLLPGYRPYCPYRRDLARARRLVAASGTRGAHVTLWTPEAEPFRSELEYVASVLRQLGYRVTLTAVDTAVYYQRVADSRRRAQAGEWSWIADYPAASDFLELVRCSAFRPNSAGNSNVPELCDRTLDTLISRAQALELTNPQRANDVWAQADRRVTDLAAFAPLYVARAVDFVSRRVGNYQFSPQWGALLDQLWVR
jgi:peptide/nickel transport system substrate-binding protein